MDDITINSQPVFVSFFELLGLPTQFTVNETELRQKYHVLSRQFHPDFFTNASESEKNIALEKTALLNLADQTLSNPKLRLKHLLEINGQLPPNEKYQLPASFLGDMMELNEAIMELEFNPDTKNVAEINETINNLTENLNSEAQTALNTFDNTAETAHFLPFLKQFYYKQQYLLRIQESLRKFAPTTNNGAL